MDRVIVMVVPSSLAERLDAVVERLSKSLGEPVEDCRRLVERHILAGGVVRFERALEQVIAERLKKESA